MTYDRNSMIEKCLECWNDWKQEYMSLVNRNFFNQERQEGSPRRVKRRIRSSDWEWYWSHHCGGRYH